MPVIKFELSIAHEGGHFHIFNSHSFIPVLKGPQSLKPQEGVLRVSHSCKPHFFPPKIFKMLALPH